MGVGVGSGRHLACNKNNQPSTPALARSCFLDPGMKGCGGMGFGQSYLGREDTGVDLVGWCYDSTEGLTKRADVGVVPGTCGGGRGARERSVSKRDSTPDRAVMRGPYHMSGSRVGTSGRHELIPAWLRLTSSAAIGLCGSLGSAHGSGLSNNNGSIIHKCNPSFTVPSVSALRGPHTVPHHSPTYRISQRAVVSVRAHGSPDVKRPPIINCWHPTQARKKLHAVGLRVGVSGSC